MTNEEAIALLEDQMNFNRTMQRGWGNSMIETDAGKIVDGTLYANQHKDVADALELAINALRAGGKGMNVPTMPAGQPLTLEQLRGMGGKPVWIMASPDWGHWELSEDAEDYLADRDTSLYGITYPDHDCKGGVHQLRWIAYAYPPAHINREAWTGCTCNTKSKSCCTCVSLRCQFCIGESEYKRGKYCSACGRPLTEEAWAELEKRVRGNELKAYFEGEKGVLVFKPLPGGKRGRPKKRTNEERLKQMGTQELARELSLIAMWDRKQLKKAQENPGLEAFMGKWLREPAEDN